MTSPAFISAPDHSQSKPSHQYMAVWTLVAVLALTACAVMVLDASITPEQRFAIFLQSGMFP
jgi:ABC-type transport system involved in cytochrome c biogenesis permease subunit